MHLYLVWRRVKWRISGRKDHTDDAPREYGCALLCCIMADFVAAEDTYRRVIELVSSFAAAHSTLDIGRVAFSASGVAIDGGCLALELAPLASDT